MACGGPHAADAAGSTPDGGAADGQQVDDGGKGRIAVAEVEAVEGVNDGWRSDGRILLRQVQKVC